MQNKFVWSFLSLVTLTAGGLLGGCDSDAKIAKSAAGESCDKTSDCDDGLKCLEGTCYKGSSSSGGSANNAGGEGNTAGSTVVGPKPPVLGGLGESCTKRADCEDGLACLNERCSEDVAVGDGGEGSGGPALGGEGETCGLTSDCADGLACLPSDGYLDLAQAKAIGSNSVGVCSPIDNGLEPTGKACGAECLTAADCCELPYEVHASIAAESCTELAGLLDGVNCDTATGVTLNAMRCFAQSAYCECAKNTWACEQGTCSYTAACSVATMGSPDGCPQYTRSGKPLATPCDTAGTKKCTPVAGDPVCKTDAQCTGQVVTTVPAGVAKCAAGECTCYKETGLCYRKCEETLDCPANYSCDEKTSVCVADAGCTSDAECVTRINDIRAKCFPDGMCEAECNNDRDCNYGSLTNGLSTRICNADKRCEAVGCSSDRECSPTAYGLRIFCAETPSLEAPSGITSAITD